MRSLAFIFISMVLLLSIMLATSAVAAPQSLTCNSPANETRIVGIIDTDRAKLTIESEVVYGIDSDFETSAFGRKLRSDEDTLSFAKYTSTDSTWYKFRISIPKTALGTATTNFPAYFGWIHDEGTSNGELELDCRTKLLPISGVLSWDINQLDNGELHDLNGLAKYTLNGELGHIERVIKKAYFAEEGLSETEVIAEILHELYLQGVSVSKITKTATNINKVVKSLDYRKLGTPAAKKQIKTLKSSLERNSVGRNVRLFKLSAEDDYYNGILNGFAVLDLQSKQLVIVVSGYSE